jgi:hypothetical protein
MNFKLWLETDVLSWSPNYPHGWYPAEIGDRPTIQVFIDSKRVSVDFASPYHPLLKRALKALVRQKPEVLNLTLEFDGFSPGTVNEFLGMAEFHGKKDVLPKYLYTGTSYYRWEKIREEGLKPRSETQEEPVYGANISSAPPANPDHVYLAVTLGATVRWAANDASRDGSYPVILRIDSRGLNPRLIRPDVDVRSEKWLDSFHRLGTIAYEGNIAPQFIELIQAKKDNKWEKPGPWLEPQDWLAQQMLHRTGYTKIPNTNHSYKWVNPKER